MRNLIREIPAMVGVSAGWGVIIFFGTWILMGADVRGSALSGLGAASLWLVIIFCWEVARVALQGNREKQN